MQSMVDSNVIELDIQTVLLVTVVALGDAHSIVHEEPDGQASWGSSWLEG